MAGGNERRLTGMGIIGCGGQGMTWASQMRGNPRCQLHAVTDVDSAKAHRVAACYDAATVRAYADLDALLADPRVDAVIDCTPPAFHAGNVRESLRAGKHVLVEKPLAATLEQAERILEAAQAAPNLAVVHGAALLAMSPVVSAAREWLSEGLLGELWEARIDYTHTHLPHGWFVQKQISGGGALIDLFPHPATALLWLVGSQLAVEAASFVLPQGAEIEHLARLRLRHADGYLVEVTTAWHDQSSRSRIMLVGAKGSLAIELFSQQAQLCDPFGRTLAAVDFGPSFDPHYHRLIEHFLDAVDDPASVRIGDIETACRIQRLIAEAYVRGTFFGH